MSIKLCVVLALFVLMHSAQSQKTVQVTCSTCTSGECSSGYCFKLAGDSFSDTVCSSSACDLTINQTVTLTACSYDYSSTSCSSGVCFSLGGKQLALLGGKCASTYTQNYTCGSCTGGVVCSSGKCQSFKNGSATSVVSCVEGCSSVANSNVTVSACTSGKDVIGVSSTCCINFDTTFSSASTLCTTQSTTLSSSTMLTWVKGTSSNFQFSPKTLLALLALCLAIMIL